jgi:hypothetical protein
MIGIFQRDKAGSPFYAPIGPILIGHLQGNFHGSGTVIGEENPGETGRGLLHQLLRQKNGRHIGYAQHSRVGNLIQLGLDGLIDLRPSMAMDVHPQRRNTINIALTLGVNEIDALSLFDDERRTGGIIRHLGKRMPKILEVLLYQCLIVHDHPPEAAQPFIEEERQGVNSFQTPSKAVKGFLFLKNVARKMNNPAASCRVSIEQFQLP